MTQAYLLIAYLALQVLGALAMLAFGLKESISP